MNQKNSGRVSLGAIWLSLCLGALPVFAEEYAAIVVGSFSTRITAENFLEDVSRAYDLSLTVTAVERGGRTLYRVHSIPAARPDEVRRRLESIRSTWNVDAWLWRMEVPMAPPRVIAPGPDPEPTPIPEPVPAAPTVATHVEKLSRLDATTRVLMVARQNDAEVHIDGRLDEPVWETIEGYDNMIVIEPDVLEKPAHGTRTKLFYTDDGLYVGIQAEQPLDKLIPRLSSRDQEINRDGIWFYLDTSGEGLYGLFFGVNLGGTLIDGTMLPERQISMLWDGPWDGRATRTDYGYSTEMFLPWSMMSMPEVDGPRKMGFSVSRQVAYLDEKWSWPALPTSKPVFMSGLQPMELSNVRPRRQLALYPFGASTHNNIRDETEHRLGMDIFWRPSSDLQLTATLNPDFGTVESDDVVVNLTAYETFYPEKRLFFLEGNEIFITSPRSVGSGIRGGTGSRQVPNDFALQPMTIVNTRRIGGAPPAPDIPDNVTIPDVQLSQPTELAGAAKVTGQSGPFRYGVLAAFEEDPEFRGYRDDGTPVRLEQEGRDFSVARLLYEKVGETRQSLGWLATRVDYADEDAVTHGIDAHYRSRTGRVYWDGQLLFSDVEDTIGRGGFVDINYIPSQGHFHRLSFDYFDDQLDLSDLGFIRRNDVVTWRYIYSTRSSDYKRVRQVANSYTFSHETNTDGLMVRSSLFYHNTLTFLNRNQLNTTMWYRPEQWDDRESEGNGAFRTAEGGLLEVAYGTDTSRPLSASLGANGMSEALGDWSYTAKGGITWKPNDRFSLDFDLYYRTTTGWLVHLDGPVLATYEAEHWRPSIGLDLFLTARQQLRFTLQWVGIDADAVDLWRVPAGDGDLIRLTDGVTMPDYDFTISRLTTQLRYRWEIAPLSDLFIVYTRGSNLPNRGDDEFGDLFHDALTDPVIDRFVVKLRYRFGL